MMCIKPHRQLAEGVRVEQTCERPTTSECSVVRRAPARWPCVPNRKSGVLPVGDGTGPWPSMSLCDGCSRSTCLLASCSNAAMISLTAASSSGFEPLSHHTTRPAPSRRAAQQRASPRELQFGCTSHLPDRPASQVSPGPVPGNIPAKSRFEQVKGIRDCPLRVHSATSARSSGESALEGGPDTLIRD
jgi:hypothetical protein